MRRRVSDERPLETRHQDVLRETRLRRGSRASRRRRTALVVFAGLTLLTLAAPSIACFAGLGRQTLARQMATRGWIADAASVRMGWITPLSVRDLRMTGPSDHSIVALGQLDANVTLLDVLRGSIGTKTVELSASDLTIEGQVRPAGSSLEDDLRPFLESPTDQRSSDVNFVVERAELKLTDAGSGDVWSWGSMAAEGSIGPATTHANVEGILAGPGGASGQFAGQVILPAASNGPTEVLLEAHWIPLSFLDLVRKRFEFVDNRMPDHLGGDISGILRVQQPGVSGDRSGPTDLDRGPGEWLIDADKIQLREFIAADDHSVPWRIRSGQLDGQIIHGGSTIEVRELNFESDFAMLTMNALLPGDVSWFGSDSHPLRFLEAIDGVASGEVDLPKLQAAMPGLIPTRTGTELQSGLVRFELDNGLIESGHRSRIRLQSDTVIASDGRRSLRLDPVTLRSDLSSTADGSLRADAIDFRSGFGYAEGGGTFEDGRFRFDLDFASLARSLGPILEIDAASLGGQAKGDVRWSVARDGRWSLRGNANGQDVRLGDGSTQRDVSDSVAPAMITNAIPDSFRTTFEVVGKVAMGNGRPTFLEELQKVDVRAVADDTTIRVELAEPIVRTAAETVVPIRYTIDGEIAPHSEMLAQISGAFIRSAQGHLHVEGLADFDSRSLRIRSASGDIESPRLVIAGHRIAQPNCSITFDGLLDPIHRVVDISNATLAAEAVSAAVVGRVRPDDVDLKMNVRAKLERLQQAAGMATDQRLVQVAGYRSEATSSTETWYVAGDVVGDLDVRSTSSGTNCKGHFEGEAFTLLRPHSGGLGVVGPSPGRDPFASSANRRYPRPATESAVDPVLWREPTVDVAFDIEVPHDGGADPSVENRMAIHRLQLQGDWFDADLSGTLAQEASTLDDRDESWHVLLEGNGVMATDKVAEKLSRLSGTTLLARGRFETPVTIEAVGAADHPIDFRFRSDIGWREAAAGGVVMGPARVPIEMTPTSVRVTRSEIPVGSGSLIVGGSVHHQAPNRWIELDAGPILQQVELTPEMTDRWLRYLAPIVDQAADVSGVVSVHLSEGIVPLDRPRDSRVVGTMQMHSASMTAGPMVDSILVGVDRARQLAGSLRGEEVRRSGRTLVTMPPQRVDFAIREGIVTHDRMRFGIDRADVVTSGDVSVDGELNLVAQMPIDSRWVGRDLGALEGRHLTLPVRGRLDNIQVDTSEVGRLITSAVVEAGAQKVDGLLRNELNRQFDKLLGR